MIDNIYIFFFSIDFPAFENYITFLGESETQEADCSLWFCAHLPIETLPLPSKAWKVQEIKLQATL